MSKARSMGAGAGGLAYGVNTGGNQGGGNKKQGLLPTATNYFISRAGHNNFYRAHGNNRNKVFCMNQLGGVGRGRSQFGPGSRDGVNPVAGGCVTTLEQLEQYIQFLINYFKIIFPNYTLCLVGELESVKEDIDSCINNTTLLYAPFIHLTSSDFHYDDDNSSVIPVESLRLDAAFETPTVYNKVAYVNGKCSYITGTGCAGIELGVHTLGLVPNDEIETLQTYGYGLAEWNGLNVYKGCTCEIN